MNKNFFKGLFYIKRRANSMGRKQSKKRMETTKENLNVINNPILTCANTSSSNLFALE
jgi:hypothetical protein